MFGLVKEAYCLFMRNIAGALRRRIVLTVYICYVSNNKNYLFYIRSSKRYIVLIIGKKEMHRFKG